MACYSKKASCPHSSVLRAAHFTWPLTLGVTTSRAEWAEAYWAAVSSSAPHINIQKGTGMCEHTRTRPIFLSACIERWASAKPVHERWTCECAEFMTAEECVCATRTIWSTFRTHLAPQRLFVDQYWSFDFYLKLIETYGQIEMVPQHHTGQIKGNIAFSLSCSAQEEGTM